jgi:hypothetical protein
VIWCFAAREFTEGSGWQPLKFGLPDAASDRRPQ